MDMLTSDQKLEIKSESARAVVSLKGAQVLEWDALVGGKHVQTLYQGSSAKRTGIPLLFPHFGKSEKYRMHGFGRDTMWEMRRCAESEVEVFLNEELLDNQARAEYPYKFEASVTVKLLKNRLDYELIVRNKDTETLPIMPGLHPYWKINHAEKDGLIVKELGEFDAQKVNWTESPPDNVYEYVDNIEVILPNFAIKIGDRSAEKNLKRLVIWSQTPTRDPDYDFVCVEPTCGAHYEIDHNPIMVNPQKEWRMCVSFECVAH